MQGYEEIFAKRGKSYHQAMDEYSTARNEEFQISASYLESTPGSTILDVPAGGRYLRSFLPDQINYLAYDFSGEFDDNHSGVKKCKEASIELADQSADEIISLAALHHVVERSSFFKEMFRVLKPKGQFVIADVVVGSRVDHFLNGFLNEWNSMGHKGVFLNFERDAIQLEKVGFAVRSEVKEFGWVFTDSAEARDFFRKLFFLDLNPSDELLQAALEKLGVVENSENYRVSWSLGIITASKT